MKNLFLAVALLFALWSPAQAEEIDREKLRAFKMHLRAQIMDRQVAVPTIAPADNDQAAKLVDVLRFRTLAEMEAHGLKKGEVERRPWSDTYWPIYAGGLANRYADPGYAPDVKWEKNERYLISQLGRGPLARLSPAEKYDLLVGDPNFSLSKQMIEEGRPYYEASKKVETWMGYCHGWAAASFMVDRPSHSVTVTAADGRSKIELYPADIRGLATLLWANGNFGTRFVGGRCDKKNPPLDDHGRPKDSSCIDTNPATWHLAVVNQVGVVRRSMVLDTTWSAEVWNQPIVGYDYHYQNYRTHRPVEKIENAKVPVSDSDSRRAYRAPGTTHIVRVAMNLLYGLERSPDTAATDNETRDVTGRVLYEYELELDANGGIIGGEWLYNSHPDFLWVPVKGARAFSDGDLDLDRQHDTSQWQSGASLPVSWRKSAIESSKSGQPLAHIVEQLVRWAN